MKKVLTYGTYDVLHYGHFRLLKRAKELGDHLTVAISTDEFNLTKGKKCVQPYNHRAEVIKAIRYVDEVIPENNWDQKIDDIRKHNIDIFVMGCDWKGKFDFLKEYCEVVYLERTPDISTTKLKKHINSTENHQNDY
ncbi:MAG TPA: glycerol-3-phosphate cytidylyltransferase [Candidatus Cloacimonetes bacterium]|nr:glycerol-3-phosphate cytidylyltransferase [Candidatus Cloacimonadota bacterium]